MPTTTPLTDAINALTQYANETTGQSDTTLSEAVGTLVAGYGGGGGWSADGIADRSEPSGEITLTVATVKDYAFYGCTALTKVSSSTVTTVQTAGFQNCTNTVFDMPNLTTVQSNSFRGVEPDLYLPGLTTITASYAFGGANNNWLVLPRLTSALGSDYMRQLYYTKLDLGFIPSFGTRALYQGIAKVIVILRNTSVVTAQDANAIGAINGSTTVYVPSALISQYESNSVWGAKGCTFVALEGSPYEQLDWYENQ